MSFSPRTTSLSRSSFISFQSVFKMSFSRFLLPASSSSFQYLNNSPSPCSKVLITASAAPIVDTSASLKISSGVGTLLSAVAVRPSPEDLFCTSSPSFNLARICAFSSSLSSCGLGAAASSPSISRTTSSMRPSRNSVLPPLMSNLGSSIVLAISSCTVL